MFDFQKKNGIKFFGGGEKIILKAEQKREVG